jgi:hypothetical protein
MGFAPFLRGWVRCLGCRSSRLMTTREYRPDEPSLLIPRLKVKRAVEHLDELEPEMRAYVEREPYRTADQPDIEGDWIVMRICEVRE